MRLSFDDVLVSRIDRVHERFKDTTAIWIEIAYEDQSEGVQALRLSMNEDQYERSKDKLNPTGVPVTNCYQDPITGNRSYR